MNLISICYSKPFRREGRYRVFAELEREVGGFPRANIITRAAPMRSQFGVRTIGQHPAVLAAMRAALDSGDAARRRRRSGSPNAERFSRHERTTANDPIVSHQLSVRSVRVRATS